MRAPPRPQGIEASRELGGFSKRMKRPITGGDVKSFVFGGLGGGPNPRLPVFPDPMKGFPDQRI